jgi:putative glutamine amidotransferase
VSTYRPLIGIPCASYAHRPYPYPPVQGNNETYIQAVERLGGVPLLIPLLHQEPALRSIFDRLDGLLFAGGSDIDPALYGEEPHPNLGTVNPTQDQVELTLMGWARAWQMPIFGICRGFQVMNVAYGGTLYQDLPTQQDAAGNHQESFDRKVRDHLSHAMKVDGASRLASMLDATDLSVNTLHHQAIKDLGPGLRAIAWADDGIIEAVESTLEPWVIGVQCHPEELVKGADQRWDNVFRDFLTAAQSWHLSKRAGQS